MITMAYLMENCIEILLPGRRMKENRKRCAYDFAQSSHTDGEPSMLARQPGVIKLNLFMLTLIEFKHKKSIGEKKHLWALRLSALCCVAALVIIFEITSMYTQQN